MLLGVLTFSIVGIPCLFLVLGVLFGMAIYGKTAFFLLIGGTLLAGRLKPLAVIFGYILYFMATSVPYIDWVTFLVVNSIAVGICFARRRGTTIGASRSGGLHAAPGGALLVGRAR